MRINSEQRHRRSIRLKGYDYALSGAYYVTVCAEDRACLFGDVVDGQMRLNPLGEMVRATWHDLPNHLAHVQLDAFVIMPNHIHAIILITETPTAVGLGSKPAQGSAPNITTNHVGAGSKPAQGSPPNITTNHVGAGSKPAQTQHTPACAPKRHGLPEIVRQFKTFSARRINEYRGTPGTPVWQRDYYEHIIRNEEELQRIREYIVGNPANWPQDNENPNRR